MVKKLLFAVSAISILGLTSCVGGDSKSFTFDVIGSSYVAKNNSYTYNATKEGVIDNNVTWRVDNSDLASIDDKGVLTIKESTGTLNVIATSKENRRKVAKHQVTIVGDEIERSTFINKLKEQEDGFWETYSGKGKFSCSPSYNKEIDFIKVPNTERYSKIENILFSINCDPLILSKNLNVYVTDELNPEIWIDCYEGREYPTADHIQTTFDKFDEIQEKYKETFKGKIDCFTYTVDYESTTYNHVAYYLEYEYEDAEGNIINKLIYRSFTEGCIINYLEINDDSIDAYLHLNPLK